MKSPPLYVLDTNILVHLCRNDALGQEVNRRFDLPNQVLRPTICIVTHGEIHSFARLRDWGEPKLKNLVKLMDNLVTVDINSGMILQAYAEIDVFSQRYPDGARNMGKNDLWIAAVTRATRGTLLTTDKDFDHLHPAWIKREYIDPEHFQKKPIKT